jgi:hypothetical protein
MTKISNKLSNGMIISSVSTILISFSLYAVLVRGDNILRYLSRGGNLWITIFLFLLVGAIVGFIFSLIMNLDSQYKKLRFEKKLKPTIYSLVLLISLIPQMFFIVAVVLLQIFGSRSGFFSIQYFQWEFPLGCFLIPAIGFAVSTIITTHIEIMRDKK